MLYNSRGKRRNRNGKYRKRARMKWKDKREDVWGKYRDGGGEMNKKLYKMRSVLIYENVMENTLFTSASQQTIDCSQHSSLWYII